jgi:site-specific DNA-methyltransferase (adenine-specific)
MHSIQNGITPSHRVRPQTQHEAVISRHYLTQHRKLDLLYEKGFIKIESGAAWPIYERAILPTDGPAAPDIWAFQPYTEGTVFGSDAGIDMDVRWLSPRDAERLGYPTQKPVALLERIISASSNPGDVVLDPFCGCGTTVHAAQKLERQWTGIDITHLAISLIEKRLRDAFAGIEFDVHGTPKDLEGARALADQDKYQFQWWAVSLVDAVPYGGKKKGADSGIDGLIYFKPDGKTTEKAIVSVKGGSNVSVAMIRDLAHVVDREKAKIGVFITLAESTSPMRTEAVKAGFFETEYGNYPKVQIITIAELFAGKRPAIPLIDSSSFKKAPRENPEKQGTLL